MDPKKVVAIINMNPPTNVKQLWSALGHIGNYQWFIHSYTSIIAPMESLIKKAKEFKWTVASQVVLNMVKEKLVSMLRIMIFIRPKPTRVS